MRTQSAIMQPNGIMQRYKPEQAPVLRGPWLRYGREAETESVCVFVVKWFGKMLFGEDGG